MCGCITIYGKENESLRTVFLVPVLMQLLRLGLHFSRELLPFVFILFSENLSSMYVAVCFSSNLPLFLCETCTDSC